MVSGGCRNYYSEDILPVIKFLNNFWEQRSFIDDLRIPQAIAPEEIPQIVVTDRV